MLINHVKHVSIRKLFHEFIVDVWVAIEKAQLHWVGMNFNDIEKLMYTKVLQKQ
jgi:hypothetical protein